MKSKIRRRTYRLLAGLLSLGIAAWGDTGVLIPMNRRSPDPAILSLREMNVDVHVDNGDARVRMRQIFANHTGSPEEGNYQFALPTGAQVSDFAVWDGPVRIPAVVLARKRASEVYQALKSQAIDPGLLQQGEQSEAEARRSGIFSADIAPVPAWGTKRLEIEYHQPVPVSARKSYFVLPLKPSAYGVQHVEHLTIHFDLDTAARVQDFTYQGKVLPFHIDTQDAHGLRGTVDVQDVNLTEDFAVTWSVGEPDNALEIVTYRNPHPVVPPGIEAAPATPQEEEAPGYVEGTAQFGGAGALAGGTASPRTVVILMDTSFSMQWDKLEHSYAAAAKILASLRPGDRFNLLLFNTGVAAFRPAPVPADASATMAAMNWLRAQPLGGGTDLQQGLAAGLQQALRPGTALVLLSDGGADRGLVQNGHLAAWYTAKWKALPAGQRPKTDIFAVGDDANLPLLRMLAGNGGAMEQVLSSEPVEYKLAAFLNEMGHDAVRDLGFEASPAGAIHLVYPLQDSVFPGGQARWVGQYARPQKSVAFHAGGREGTETMGASASAELPEQALEHDQLPRLWAGARVRALLDQIERNGETAAAVNEIIRLAKQYKFVTPYSSFLAAPRALLRPRVIQPGDPLLRVHTDPAIVSVIALFPFGPEKPLRYLPAGDDSAIATGDAHTRVWETRFLAPPNLRDGAYTVRLILRDRDGRVYRESKSFVIDSTPPVVRLRLPRTRFRAGEIVPLRVSASAWTRTITAEIAGLAPVDLRWNDDAHASTGQLLIPAGLPPGEYAIQVTAEDAAHNVGRAEVKIAVVP